MTGYNKKKKKNELVERVVFSGYYRITSKKKTADKCLMRDAAYTCGGEKDTLL